MQTAVLLAAVLFGFPYICSARKVKGILLVGNYSRASPVELFDPNSGSTLLPIELSTSCAGLYKMNDSRFLVIDNWNSGDTFYLDLCTNTSEPGPPLVRKRLGATSAWLGGPNGTVVVCGGDKGDGNYLKSCERLVNNRWVETEGWNMAKDRSDFAMATMPDGRLVAAGGYNYNKEELSNHVAFLKDGIWTDGAPLRTAREGHAMITSDEGVVSVYGGYGSRRPRTSEYYNGDSKKWEVGPSMMQGRVYFDMALYDGELYAIGGWRDNGSSMASVERLNTSLNNFVWAKHNLTAGRSCHCALAVDVECPTQQSTTTQPTSEPTTTPNATHLKGILLIGNGTVTKSTVELYDPEHETTILHIIVEGLEGFQYCGGLYKMPDGRFLAIDNSATGKTYYLDLCARKAVAGPQMVKKRWFAASAWSGNVNASVLVCGGRADGRDGEPQKSCEILSGGKWATADVSIVKSRVKFAMTPMPDGTIAFTGGLDEYDTPVAEIAFLQAGRYTIEKPMGVPRSLHAAYINGDGYVTVCGGMKNEKERTDDCEYYRKGRFRPGVTLKHSRGGFTITEYSETQYAIGGDSETSLVTEVECYDPSQTPNGACRTPNGAWVIAKGHGLKNGRSHHCALAVDINCE